MLGTRRGEGGFVYVSRRQIRSAPRNQPRAAKMQKSPTFASSLHRFALRVKPISQNARCKTPGFCQPHCDFNISSKSQHFARQQVTTSARKTPDAKPSKPRGLKHFAREHTKPARQNSPLVSVMLIVPVVSSWLTSQVVPRLVRRNPLTPDT